MDGRANSELRLKRAYDAAEADDGVRVLIDRLWPRGVGKAQAAIDLWLRDIAPSVELRQWFSHDVSRWAEFRQRYRRELDDHADELATLRRHMAAGRVTLLFAAKDREHNNAVALREYLLDGGEDP